MIVRQATLSDAQTIARFNVLMAEETEHIHLDPARVLAGVEAVLRDPAKGWYMVAEVHGEVVGQLMVTYEWSDWRNGVFWWIQSVFVADEFRAQGVYRALYEELERQAHADSGVCGIRLYVETHNTRAQHVYEKMRMARAHYLVYENDFVIERT